MTPAQLAALSRVHERVNRQDGQAGAEPEQGTVGDLLAFQAMRTA